MGLIHGPLGMVGKYCHNDNDIYMYMYVKFIDKVLSNHMPLVSFHLYLHWGRFLYVGVATQPPLFTQLQARSMLAHREQVLFILNIDAAHHEVGQDLQMYAPNLACM